ncbi:B-cell lymphoma/leukemia 10 [Neosynchiropus ocellatus]
MMDVPQLTEDEMAEVKKDVLIRLRPYLCDKIRADRHLDFLRSRRILTRDDAEEISRRTTQTKRTAWLLDILAENPHGLDALIDSIREMRSQNFIVVKLTDEVQKARNEKLESLRAAACSTPAASVPSSSLDLSRTFSTESTLLFHPEGEQSLSAPDAAGSLKLRSFQKSDVSLSAPGVSVASCATSAGSLPKPGDPGAPPVPDEALESTADMDVGSPGCTSSGGDFQPLRSRSLTPTPHSGNW